MRHLVKRPLTSCHTDPYTIGIFRFGGPTGRQDSVADGAAAAAISITSRSTQGCATLLKARTDYHLTAFIDAVCASELNIVRTTDWENEKTPVLTLKAVAEYLRVHPSTIYRLLKTKQLPAFKLGRDWRFNKESVDRWRSEAERSMRRSV